MTNTGCTAVRKLNPYILQQAETMCTSGGISYEHFTNTVRALSVSNLGNDASKNLQVRMNAGAWTMLRDVDFGSTGAQSFSLYASGKGKMEIRLQSPSAKPAATIEFASASIEQHDISLDPKLFKGVNKVFFIFTEASTVQFDAWQFSESPLDGIRSTSISTTHPTAIYDINGRRLKGKPSHGIYIQNGKKHTAQ